MKKDNIMKRILFLAAAAFAFAGITGCQEEKTLETTDKGPEMEVLSVDESAYFGGNLHFSVSLNDAIALSTLKAQLYFDEEKVAETVVRTKTNGTYTDTLVVPFAAEIPNGTATIKFVGQNIKFGLTSIEKQVEVSRPQPDKIYLMMDGEKIEMPRQSDYLYSVTKSFPQKPKGYFRVEGLDADGSVANFGWASGAVAWDTEALIPFSNAVAGEYAITFDLFSFVASPFLTLKFGEVEMSLMDGFDSRYSAVLPMKQGTAYTFEGLDISEWTIDSDWFSREADGTLKSLVIDGNYCVIVDTEAEVVTAMTCDASGNFAKFDTATGKGALYLVGDGLGKPNMAGAPGWTPEKGLCLAPVAEGVYQITGIAGLTMKADDINFKFFGQNDDWGPVELKNDMLSSTDETVFVGDGDNGADEGNIKLQEGKTFEPGGVYIFTITWNGGSGVLTLKKNGEVELPKEDLSINGTALTQADASNYYGVFELNQGDKLVPGGFGDLSAWWADTNYVTLDGGALKFLPVAGRYKVSVNTDAKTVFFKEVKADGSDAEFEEDGALWLMGWGVGAPSLDNQFGFNPGAAYCIPEVSAGVYQFAGLAGQEKGSSVGQYFRTDYLSFKFFHQNGWGGEYKASAVTLDGGLLKPDGEGNNIELADGKTLTEGKAYILRIDVSKGDKPTITLVQAD